MHTIKTSTAHLPPPSKPEPPTPGRKLVKRKRYDTTRAALRLPPDLAAALNTFCRTRAVRRTDAIIAALRMHLKAPDPALTPAKEK
jgi:hypothetical protein